MADEPSNQHEQPRRFGWLRDGWLWGALGVAVVLRVLPMVLWGTSGCMRDECGYRELARNLLEGNGLITQDNWLWAPGYPHLIAALQWIFGTPYAVKWLQVGVSLATIVVLYQIAQRVLSDRRAARLSAWMLALHPTMAFFVGTLWSETVYVFVLLSAVLAMLWARDGRWYRALGPGILIGICVLFRGIATYMTPLLALAMLWPAIDESFGHAVRRRWPSGVLLFVAAVLTVAPYSAHVSSRHGGFIVSDATLGRMMWLGDNDFPPITFDYGNGHLRNSIINKWALKGRQSCDEELDAYAWNKCETSHGFHWIKENPSKFLKRIPLRWAQTLNPHSFLTRHIRLGKWTQLPMPIKEFLGLWVVAVSIVVIVGGTAGAWLRARGAFGFLAPLVVLYHMAAVGALAGMTRYRIPLEPLWIVFVCAIIARPRHAWSVLTGAPWRAVGLCITVPVVTYLVLWFLPAGFPGFY